MCWEFTVGSKLIIWTGFVDNVNWLADKLAEFDPVCIHGSLPMHQRNQAVQSFTNSSNLVLIATPGAAKEGLTLTVANHAIFYDRGFGLDDYLQAQDRIHRISQTRECFIHNLIANETIDEWVDVLLMAKYRAAQLAQGDIAAAAFRNSFRTDISEVLQGVLFPDRATSHHQSSEESETTRPMNPDKTTIAIMGQDIPATHELIPIHQLHFLPDNPRVYAAIREMADFSGLTPEEKQLRIYKRLLQESSVKNLMPEIQRDGGLQDPIIVRWDTQEVIEGNSRLAAYRKLDEPPDDESWTHIRCLVVKTLSADQQTRLLGQSHLHGKTEWSPYAKALFCFRWAGEEQRDISTLADLSGFTPAEIKKNVKTIELMQENDDNTLSNFSYYYVLVRNRVISSAIEDSKLLRGTLLSQIKTGDFTAQEMRERLPTIITKA